MKKLIFGTALAFFGLSMSVASADGSYYPVQYDPSCCSCGPDFDGFYVGGNIGVISHTAHRHDLDGFLTDNAGWSRNDIDFTAGLQLGYDWQCDNAVVGLVVDWNWVNIDHRVNDNPNVDGTNYIHNEFDWFTTIRARAGVAVCGSLIYVTGGAAVSRFKVEWTDEPDSFNFSDHRWGWTGGFGVEYLLGCNWSLGAEFLFIHYGHSTHSGTTAGGVTFDFGHSDSAWVGRILLNYRFGDLCSCFFR